MRLALIALPSEIRPYIRCIFSLEDVRWIGFGGYPYSFPYICPSGEEGNLDRKAVYFDSVDALMDAADLVLVAGHRKDRFGYISKALRKGKAVWSIGPVCETWEETAKLASLAQEARVCNQVFHADRETSLLRVALPYMNGVGLMRFDVACTPGSMLNADWESSLLFPAFDTALALGNASVRKMKVRSASSMGVFPADAVVDIEFMSGMEAFLWMDRLAGMRRFSAIAVAAEQVVRMDFLKGCLEIQKEPGNRGIECRGHGPAGGQGQEKAALSSHRKTVRAGMIRVGREISPARPLSDNIHSFVQAVRSGIRSRFGFLQSSEVQERFTQFKRSLYA